MNRFSGFLLTVILAACGGGGSKADVRTTTDTTGLVSTPATAAPTDSSLRITISSDDHVYANGKPLTTAHLDSLLTALKAIEGEVWYYREPRDPQVTPAQEARVDSVLAAMSARELVVRVSHQPDFSDIAGLKHRSPDRP
jgi:hypothetical protein